MFDILTPEEDEYFKKTMSMYMEIAKNKNVELSPQLTLANMINIFELYMSDIGRVYLNRPPAKNMRNIILKKIAEFRKSILAQENGYFMELMDDTVVLLNNIHNGEKIAEEDAAQAAQAQAAQAAAQEAWDQIIAEEHDRAAQEWAQEGEAQELVAQAGEQAQAAQAGEQAQIDIQNDENWLIRHKERHRKRRLRKQLKYEDY